MYKRSILHKPSSLKNATHKQTDKQTNKQTNLILLIYMTRHKPVPAPSLIKTVIMYKVIMVIFYIPPCIYLPTFTSQSSLEPVKLNQSFTYILSKNVIFRNLANFDVNFRSEGVEIGKKQLHQQGKYFSGAFQKSNPI